MKSSDSDTFDEHLEELRLPYLENLLSPEESSKFEEHLKNCPHCEKEIRELSGWISLLKSNKDALCPEEWQLFDYSCGRTDTSGVLASHLDLCSSCRKSVEAFEALTHQGGMPDALWLKMRRLDERPARGTRGIHSAWLYKLWEYIADFFSAPLALAGAVAVAILVTVLLYPHKTSTPFLGLSSVAWAPDASISNLMGGPGTATRDVTGKERLAVIIYFKDFERKPDGDRIDAFYRLLDPGKEVRLRYDVVSPSQIKEAIESAGMKQGGKEEILRVLRDKLSVSRVLVMELSKTGDQFTVHASLTDSATGAVVGESTIADVREAGLSEEMESALDTVLTIGKPGEDH